MFSTGLILPENTQESRRKYQTFGDDKVRVSAWDVVFSSAHFVLLFEIIFKTGDSPRFLLV